MKRLIPAILIFIFCLTTRAQDSIRYNPKFHIGFNAGYFKTVPGKRFISTGPGWNIELSGSYLSSPGNQFEIGYLWGATPEIDAPEYDIFEPRDHPIWFESSQVYFQYARMADFTAKWIESAVGFRVGYTKEFSEYSGPTVERKGVLLGLEPSISFIILKRITFNSSLLITNAFFTNPVVFAEKQSGQLSTGMFISLNSGFGIKF